MREAEAVGGIAPWLDLSTGINPYAYPYRPSDSVMMALPQPDAEAAFIDAARTAYAIPQQTAVAATPGTQAIIAWLPHLVQAKTVAIVGRTYGEHAHTWAASGAAVHAVETLDAAQADVTVIVNPNNPDGRIIDAAELKAFAAEGAEAGRLTVVDEAFCDLTPENTVAGAPGTLVMRSFGKFFGLAGLRLGLAAGDARLIDALRNALGPWAVSGPALEAGTKALKDDAWADAMRSTLSADRADLDDALIKAGCTVLGGTDLYRLIAHPRAQELNAALARRGVWTRRFPEAPGELRFGLPGPAFNRFAAVLERVAEGF